LKLTIDDTSIATIEESFSDIAKSLLNDYILVAKNQKYRVTNIEFYYYNNSSHKDENSHIVRSQRAKERQLLNAEWYLHKITTNPRCQHKGIDFTFGNGENCGGILLKEVVRLSDNSIFSQSKFVDELLRVLKPKDKDHFLEIIENAAQLKFCKNSSLDKHEIIRDKRRGLVKDSFKNSLYSFKLKQS